MKERIDRIFLEYVSIISIINNYFINIYFYNKGKIDYYNPIYLVFISILYIVLLILRIKYNKLPKYKKIIKYISIFYSLILLLIPIIKFNYL